MTKKPAPLYLAIDQGGHASRALLFNAQGECVAQHTVAIDTQYPCEHCVEHDPEQLVQSVTAAIEQVVKEIDVSHIISAGLATQRSSIVCWDKVTGKTLSPVISWQDTRTTDQIKSLAEHAGFVHAETGLRLSPHYGASKMKWCLDNLPEVQSAFEYKQLAMGPLASFLVYKLTREHGVFVDPTNAARSLLFNPATGTWSDMLMELFGIPENVLPECSKNIAHFGHININNHSVELNTVIGDQPASLFAHGAPHKDTIYINLGTGAFLQTICSSLPKDSMGLLKSIALHNGTKPFYAIEGTVNGAGSALHWIQKELNISDSALNDIPETGKQIPLFINSIAGLGSPFWRSDIEPRFVGEASTLEKLQSVIESILFLIQKNIEQLQKIKRCHRIVVSGGISTSDRFCQLLADISGKQVLRTNITEATARGTAWLSAGKPVHWPQPDITLSLKPEENTDLLERYAQWQQIMEQTLSEP
ncbi:MAG: FGGY family carbohydrate kinase [Gammaproteobacteria bacterium]|nr:FGGY family carbohydrate kinase [Gammaproteobacteria bacterium]